LIRLRDFSDARNAWLGSLYQIVNLLRVYMPEIVSTCDNSMKSGMIRELGKVGVGYE